MPARNSGSQSGGESANRGGSNREFAERIGVSEAAVRKAKRAGRLKESLGKDGNILDFAVAEREWRATSRTSKGVRDDVRTIPPSGSQSAPTPPPARPEPREERQASVEDGEEVQGELIFATTLIAAQTAATNERARKLKFENDVTEGRLIPVERVTKEAFEAERIIRESILNLVPRYAGELHAERDPQRFRFRFEGMLRETLSLIADTLEATANG